LAIVVGVAQVRLSVGAAVVFLTGDGVKAFRNHSEIQWD
jgi:hypothetical protein